MRRAALLLSAALAYSQSTPPGIPASITPFPGAVVDTRTYGSMVEASYTTSAKPGDVLTHYQTVFAAAGLPFVPNGDGIGTSVRASAPECDLLLKVRAVAAGSAVQVSCAARRQPSAATSTAPPDVQVIRTGPGRVSPYAASQSQRIDQAIQEGKERTRKMLADADAQHRQRIADMSKYDQPVPASTIPSPRQGKSFYNDDAPPLVWPSWLVQHGTQQPPQPAPGTDGGKKYLMSRYRTTIPMTELYQFYEDLLKANGFTVHTSHLSTGQTISGKIVQNANGAVEGSLSQDGTVNGPHSSIKVNFSRFYLNEPIKVSIQFMVTGSFGRR